MESTHYFELPKMSSLTNSSRSSPVAASNFSPTGEEYSACTSDVSSSPELSSDALDIAVIGYGCRFPGGNNSPSQLWDFLVRKGDASGTIPDARWAPYMTRQPGNAQILQKTVSKGYFLDKMEKFDASFFGISPMEAEQIDPQQRIAVEVAWEALEQAGIPPQSLAGSDTAVFMGVNSDDYSRLLLEDLPNIEAWMGVGTAFCGIPNRISYLLDLKGPSSAVDGACASSLVAIHHGRQALITRETSLVIAGGVNALLGPGLTCVLDKAGAISSDGRCRSFDDSAAGYGRGEGVGIVVLKRLADAIEDGNQILAVLKGSAVGADGRTNGIMAPNQEAQEQVARKALKEAGLAAEAISYIEAHATSTPVGDPVECAAMASVYGWGARAPNSDPCYIGSIKSNIGHLEAGAGVMGFIKAIMAIQHGIIPPQANLTTPSTKIDWEKSMLRTAMEPIVWSAKNRPRRAAVASYGYGGTVSHAILEGPPSRESFMNRLLTRASGVRETTILLLSAPQSSRIKDMAIKLQRWLDDSDHKTEDLAWLNSIAYTLAVKRGHHQFRTAVAVQSRKDAVDLLKVLAEGRQSPQIYSGLALSKDSHTGLVWVFSGHGAHWKGMGQTLLDTEPVFSKAVEAMEPIIQAKMGFSAIAALKSGDFETMDKIQVLSFVIQIGLATVLRSSGVQPTAIIGHSSGEIAAAVAAGVLTLYEGALICCVRARLCQTIAGTGAMVLVNLTFDEAAKEIGLRDDICAGIKSSPNSCVVSGAVGAVDEFSTKWKNRGLEVRTVKTDVAFHSQLLLPLATSLREALKDNLAPKSPIITLYSTTLADPRGEKTRDVEYWVENFIGPVLLTSAVNAAIEDGHRIFLEVSAHPIVSHSIHEMLADAELTDGVVLPTLLRNQDSQRNLLVAYAQLHCTGEHIDFGRILPGHWLHDVPSTTWQHKPYWRAVTTPSAGTNVNHDVDAHVLLGQKIQVSGTDGVLWQTCLDSQVKPFPGRHFLHGAEIVPAAVLLNTFLSAAPGHTLRNVQLRVPVVVGPPRQVQVFFGNAQTRISSRLITPDNKDTDDHSWLINTSTQVAPLESISPLEKIDIAEIRERLPTRLDNQFSIDYLAQLEVSEMGFPWKILEHIENAEEMLAKVHTDPEADPSKHWGGSSWASILDAATSVSSTIFHDQPLLRMPTAIDSVTVRQNALTPKLGYIYVKKVEGDSAANVLVATEEGTILVKILNLRFAGIEGKISAGASGRKGLVHSVTWPLASLAKEPLHFRKVLFFTHESPLLEGYRAYLNSVDIEHETTAEVENVSRTEDDTVIVFIAHGTQKAEQVYEHSTENSKELLSAVKALVKSGSKNQIFCITQMAFRASRALSQSSLLGLARIIKSEEPEVFGGLIDVEDGIFPMHAIKWVQGVDVIRIQDSVARNARLQPLTPKIAKLKANRANFSFYLRPEGTYIITGGLGALGLEVATWLAEKGAKRIVLLSRRSLPPRRLWESLPKESEIQRILSLEAAGVSVYTLSIDITSDSVSCQLQSALDSLSLPPVLGVVHAAGTLFNQTVAESTSDAFNAVIAPKIKGAMALHKMFPPKVLDFMILFSSCGQLVGFPGQASYASGNSFLDALAIHRRKLGDNTVSILWTSWRGLGMAASTEYIDAELHARGITDVTKDEAFHAWEQIFQHDTDHAVVLKTLPLRPGDIVPHPILTDCLEVTTPDPTTQQSPQQQPLPETTTTTTTTIPTSGPALQEYLTKEITHCVALTLSLPDDSIDPRVALSELGMDSVMSVRLRNHLQQAMRVKVGPTLIWNCPTVGHLVRHFVKEKTAALET